MSDKEAVRLVFNCRVCNKEHNGSFMKSYCSNTCREKGKAYHEKWASVPKNFKHEKERHRLYYHEKVKPLIEEEKHNGIIRCLWCKRVLEKLYDDKRYCSKRCYDLVLQYNENHKLRKNVRSWSWWKIKKEKCELCGSKSNLEVHHNAYKKDVSVCQILCINCHKKLHRKGDWI